MYDLKTGWRVAALISILIVITVLFQLGSLHIYIPGTLTQRIVTDKDVYKVGETIHARWVFVNMNPWAVPFTPPSQVDGMEGRYPGDYSPVNTLVHISYVSSSFVVQPGEEFTILIRDFSVSVEGYFTIS